MPLAGQRPATRPVCWSTQLDSLRASPAQIQLRASVVNSADSVTSVEHPSRYNENPALYSRVRKSLAATLFVTRMFAAS